MKRKKLIPPEQPSDAYIAPPQIQAGTIDQLSEEYPGLLALYSEAFKDNEALALYIRRRARQLAPIDLAMRSNIAAVALEVYDAGRRQAIIDGLNRIFTDNISPPESSSLPTDLPPAA